MKGILFFTVLFLSIGLPVGGALSEYDIIIVRSDLPYDWTVAQAYSHRAQIPIITTSPESLDQSAQEQLGSFREMGYNSILVFGGEEAVSQNVEAELVSQGFVTHRIREVDRYGTSARVAIELYERADTVVLVNAENIKSLLNSQIAALQTDAPILFIKDDEIPLSVKESFRQLEVKKIILIPSDISDQVKSELLSDFELKIFSPGAAGDLELKNLRIFDIALGLVLGAILVYILGMKKKERVPYNVLTEDEERIIRIIEESGGEIGQDALYSKTGFSRPKISRLVSELVERDLIEKTQFKRTFKLKIKKELIGA
jgi:uncharacterized membrane protein